MEDHWIAVDYEARQGGLGTARRYVRATMGVAVWVASGAVVLGLFQVEPRAGVLLGLAGLVAWWLRRQRVPRSHEARALYVRAPLRTASARRRARVSGLPEE